jgi:GT2 family glycosyltransferase
MTYPKVTIIILNWNGLNNTIKCVENLKKITYPNYKVLVIDNGSKGNDADILEERYKDYIKIIRNKENLGFTGGNNVGIFYVLSQKEPSDYVFLLNNDAKIEKKCLSYLVPACRKANAGIASAVVVEENSKEKFLGNTGKYPLVRYFFQPLFRWPQNPVGFENEFWESSCAHGAAMLIDGKTLNAVYNLTGRYLNDDLFLYLDELDFCTIAGSLGYKSITVKDAIIYHKGTSSLGGMYNPLAYYYFARNYIILGKEFFSLPIKLIFFPYNFLSNFIRAVKNMMYGRFYSSWAVFCGLYDGYTGITGKWKYHDKIMAKLRKG